MRIKTAVILPNTDNSFKSTGTHTSRPCKRRIEEEKEQTNTEEDMIRILLIAILAATVLGFPWFRNDIPNGNNVPNPCAGQAGVWQGVGHDTEPGGGLRNPFGLVRIFIYIFALFFIMLLYVSRGILYKL